MYLPISDESAPVITDTPFSDLTPHDALWTTGLSTTCHNLNLPQPMLISINTGYEAWVNLYMPAVESHPVKQVQPTNIYLKGMSNTI